jgi:DNA-binding MarR family transcriptional regulator
MLLQGLDTAQARDVGMLLSQLGYHSAALMAEQLAGIKLTPAQAGIVRAVAAKSGQSQQAISAELGVAASRLVGYVDDLERRGLVERRHHKTDRRLYALFLTEAGQQLMTELTRLFEEREVRLTAVLDSGEHETLRELLAKVAQQEGLKPLKHPAYRTLGERSQPFG